MIEGTTSGLAESSQPVEVTFQASRPDGCVTLELNPTIRDLQRHGISLREGQRLAVRERWGRQQWEAAGQVEHDGEWGWGVRVDPETLERILTEQWESPKNGS